MENLENKNLEKNTVVIDEQGLSIFNETAKWTKFISILGIFFLGIGLLVSIFVAYGKYSSTFDPIIAVIPMAVIVVIYLFPIYYLFQFSRFMNRATINKDSDSLKIAAKYLKMHYKYMGIFIIVFISIYLLFGIGFFISRFL